LAFRLCAGAFVAGMFAIVKRVLVDRCLSRYRLSAV